MRTTCVGSHDLFVTCALTSLPLLTRRRPAVNDCEGCIHGTLECTSTDGDDGDKSRNTVLLDIKPAR